MRSANSTGRFDGEPMLFNSFIYIFFSFSELSKICQVFAVSFLGLVRYNRIGIFHIDVRNFDKCVCAAR